MEMSAAEKRETETPIATSFLEMRLEGEDSGSIIEEMLAGNVAREDDGGGGGGG